MTQKTKQYKMVIFRPNWGYGQNIIWYDENDKEISRIWRYSVTNKQSRFSALSVDEFDVLRKKYEKIEEPFYTKAESIRNTQGDEYIAKGGMTENDAYIVKIFGKHSKGWAETIQ